MGRTYEFRAYRVEVATRRLLRKGELVSGSKRLSFVPGRHALIVLQGEMRNVNFWYVDLESGQQRQLTDFGREFVIRDFDIAADGREIVFDRRQEIPTSP